MSSKTCVNLITHFNIQNKSLKKLFYEYNKLNIIVKDYLNNCKNPSSIDLILIPKQLKHINQTIVRICKEFASSRDIVNIYHIFSKLNLYKFENINTFIESNKFDLINEISKECNLKFTLFSLEQQCLKLTSVLYPYQIAILISSHLKMGRFNEIFITELLNSFARLNNQESKVRIPFYNPNTLSLMVHLINVCKKNINSNLLSNVIDFILKECKNCLNKFTPLDTVTLTYSLLKYGLNIDKISNILLEILTKSTHYSIESLRESILKFEDLQQLSLLTNVMSCCFPITTGKLMKKIDYEFRVNAWSIIISRYFRILFQYKLENIDTNRYENILFNYGVECNNIKNMELDSKICEKLTNTLVSLSKSFQLDISSDVIRLTDCGITKSKFVIYQIYRLLNNVNIDSLISQYLNDEFYCIYINIYIFSDIICKIIKNYYLKLDSISSLTLSNSISALSRLHIQQYNYFDTIGNYILLESNIIKFSQNCIALICNSFSDCRFYHMSIHKLLLRFLSINADLNVIDFYHIIMALRKFGIYSPFAARWIINTSNKDYLNKLSSQGLINLLTYLMSFNFYSGPMGFVLTHYLAIQVGKLIPKEQNYELITQYKICSLIYHTFSQDFLNSWFKSESNDDVVGNFLRTKASDYLYKSLFYQCNTNSKTNLTVVKSSNFSIDVSNVLKEMSYKVELEHKRGNILFT